ncbi:hypothetical protein [Paenibacillus sp. FSL L8-0499]|uniref:hypothetical protein n=1 Tax=Paenibacillus sp. FSL L8-0499 TaxID=2975334 RepID=UPI0030F524C1
MLFTNGRFQSFEKLMKKTPHCPARPMKDPEPMKPLTEPKDSQQKEKPHGNQ